MAKFGIVGAGQAGLHLGIGLLGHGHDVVILSNQTPEQIKNGRVTSSQCMFDMALAYERALGINFWDQTCPQVNGISLTLGGPDSTPALQWQARLDMPAQSVDQRVKMPVWMAEFTKRGGEIRYVDAGIAEIEALEKECDLVLIASGKGEIGKLFERDAEKSAFDKPMRSLALTYVHDMVPREPYSAVDFSIAPGVGEYFIFPALTNSGPCEIMVFEALPSGPMDVWNAADSPEQHFEKSLGVLRDFFPWQLDRAKNARLTDDLGTLVGKFPPTIRKPVLTLPNGAKVLGIADAVCLNDPITGQGSNNASKCAQVYLNAIVANEGKPYDAAWMQATFDEFWDYARMVVQWTNGMLLPPPPHIQQILATAAAKPAVAHWFVNNFSDPTQFFPTIGDPALTEEFLKAA